MVIPMFVICLDCAYKHVNPRDIPLQTSNSISMRFNNYQNLDSVDTAFFEGIDQKAIVDELLNPNVKYNKNNR
jgi:hypothetical protein